MSQDWKLMLVAGPGAPAQLDLDDGDVTLGRREGCDLVLADPEASGRHAVLRREDDGWSLKDLGSSNGTRVNGAEVDAARLSPGDRIEIGGTMLVLAGPPAAPPAAAEAEPASPERRMLDALAALLTGEDGEPEALLAQVVEGLLEGFGADRAVLFGPGKGELVEVCARAREGVAPDAMPISRKLITRVAAEDEPVLLTSAETDELRREIHSIAGSLRSIVAAPLPLPKGPGVIYLDGELERRRFHAGDADLLRAFARAAGGALVKEDARRTATRRSARMAELQRRALAAGEIVGESGAMRAALAEVGKAATTDVTVLVTGESGTGKELIARALHRGSARADGAFVAVNCAAIPRELVESELFGHEKGAFTGAASRRLGHFELADGGTLFLDEVGELPLEVQAKLLRALQERTVRRVGGDRPVAVDFRLVCATNVDLKAAVAEGKFREDLFYRVAVFRLALPPLRARGQDVLEIADHYLRRFARDFRREVRGIDDAARALLLAHEWPGNVRELRNVIEAAVVREDSEALTPRSVRPALGLDPDPEGDEPTAGAAPAAGPAIGQYPTAFDEARKRFEREFLEHHLAAQRGNMKATAGAIQLSRKALYLKCDEYGIDYARYR